MPPLLFPVLLVARGPRTAWRAARSGAELRATAACGGLASKRAGRWPVRAKAPPLAWATKSRRPRSAHRLLCEAMDVQQPPCHEPCNETSKYDLRQDHESPANQCVAHLVRASHNPKVASSNPRVKNSPQAGVLRSQSRPAPRDPGRPSLRFAPVRLSGSRRRAPGAERTPCSRWVGKRLGLRATRRNPVGSRADGRSVALPGFARRAR